MDSVTDDHRTTDKTEKTYSVDNEEFLRTLFGIAIPEACPLVVGFQGNPSADGKPSAWYGRPRKDGMLSLPAAQNNYFSLATFAADENGKYRRKKKYFHALHAIMLDDIGTKVPHDRITLPCSWKLETSPGNYQVGYILSEPERQSAAAERLMQAIIAAGLCDPGAGGPTARLARLPVGINGKYSPGFFCHLSEWHPERRYSLQEIGKGLELDVGTSSAAARKISRSEAQHEAVHTPQRDGNAILDALQKRGLYKAPLGDGKHDITCPWVVEHTNATDGGTAYFEPDGQRPIGGFKCHHGHCAKRHISDLLENLGVKSVDARMKPVIRIISGEIPRIVDAAEQELAQNQRYYQRGGLIVTVITDHGTRETRIQECNQQSLLYALASTAAWEKYSATAQEWLPVDPPPRHVNVLFDAQQYAHLPILNGLARQPYFGKDGKIVMTPGYNATNHVFGVFAQKEFNIAATPSREDAQAALAMLADLLDDFAFASQTDRAAALSAFLTAAVRPQLPQAPMFHIQAHQIGSGKSYLGTLIAAFATPEQPSAFTFPRNDEECRKLLLSALLRGPAIIPFDNLTGDLIAHPSLCSVLTSEFFTDRPLSVSKIATVSTRALFLSSGNNVGPVHDMVRRCVAIHLDPKCETPATRTFKRPHLLADVQEKRGAYVSAALTIIQAWHTAGRPRSTCPPLAGFNQWSDTCRQPLLWLDMPDPIGNVFDAMAEDPERDTLGRLLQLWHQYFDRKPTMVRQAVTAADDFHSEVAKDLKEVLLDIAGERDVINRRRLGHWIKRNSGRVVNGLRFTKAGGSRSAEAWCVESVS